MNIKELNNKVGQKSALMYCETKKVAKKHGYRLVLRTRKEFRDTFCIFVYADGKRGRYIIGYDGIFDADAFLNFDYCLNQVNNFLLDKHDSSI